MKTHDCHVMMQRLIPVVIRNYVEDSVADTLVEFCGFFRTLCSRELRRDQVIQLQSDIVLIMCKLETIFPPAFFTIMVHLCIHLPQQVLLTGPVHYTWMFSTERQLGAYKKDVDNKRYPEACIAERHIIHECVTFINMYLNPETPSDEYVTPEISWNISVWSPDVQPIGAVRQASFTRLQKQTMHWCVLQECEEAQDYITTHREMFKQQNPHMADNEFEFRRSAIKYFPKWCDVNGVRYICKDRDQLRKTQNHGVYVAGVDGLEYYGVLLQVVQLIYSRRLPVVLFLCQWFDNTSFIYDRGLTSVNTNTSCYEDYPYMMAMNATQVFYIDDPSAGQGYKVVNKVSARGTFGEETLACTNTTDPSYEVQEPYQEDEPVYLPITELSLDLGPIPHVNITTYPDEDSDEDDEHDEYVDSDDAEGFNNDIRSDTDDDDDDDGDDEGDNNDD